jgi:hypothetical protein
VNREPVLADAIRRRIADYPLRRVPLADLLAAAASVDRSAAASVGWRQRVATAISELAGQGQIAVPSTRYDHSSDPPLPTYVTRPRTPKSKRTAPAAPVWHAEMSWAAGLDDSGMLTAADKSFLTTVNGWLPRRRGVLIPMRERSLDIFGDEKLLETRINGPLFGPGRLTSALLETYPCWPPVQQIVFGQGDWLIVENYTTYHSISVRASQIGFDGRLIWGAGKQVGTRLAALVVAGESPPPRCYYFGDLDIAGFRIAKSAAAKASEIGIPALTAARGLYRLALRHGGSAANNAPSGRRRPTRLGTQLARRRDRSPCHGSSRGRTQDCAGVRRHGSARHHRIERMVRLDCRQSGRDGTRG